MVSGGIGAPRVWRLKTNKKNKNTLQNQCVTESIRWQALGRTIIIVLEHSKNKYFKKSFQPLTKSDFAFILFIER
jgi:hypothetical protein